MFHHFWRNMFELAELKHHPANSQRWARWLCCETRWTFTRSRLDFKTAWKLNVKPEKMWLQKMGQKVTFFWGAFFCLYPLHRKKKTLFWGRCCIEEDSFPKTLENIHQTSAPMRFDQISKNQDLGRCYVFFVVVLLRWFLIWCCDDFHDDLFVVLLDDFDCNLMCQKSRQGRISAKGSLPAEWLNSRLVGSFWGDGNPAMNRVNSAGRGSTQQVRGQLSR